MNFNFDNLSKSYNGIPVLTNINGMINDGDRIGLIGPNGVGKTTLVRLLTGKEPADTGSIRCSPPDLKIFYLEQDLQYGASLTVTDLLYGSISVKQEFAGERWAKAGKTLDLFGFDGEIGEREVATLSGGEKTKLMLSMLSNPDYDLLVLDEPTNHLDTAGSEWLETVLNNQSKPVLLISHDRYFLDQTTNRIWELTAQGLRVYLGNYSDYRRQKENEAKNIAKEYRKQQQQIQHLESVINERQNWYHNAHKAAGQNDFLRSKSKKHASVIKAKERELERIRENRIEKPSSPKSPAFELINRGVTAKLPPIILRVEGLGKSFANKVLFHNLSFTVGRGEKIALMGKNGVGKSSLLKIITGLDPDFQGRVAVSPAVKLGYFAQEIECLKPELRILDELVSGGATIKEARLLLANLLFRGDEVFKKIGKLSMGEKSRVAFAKLILTGANFLVLDEPTNYLDIIAKEKIEAVLEEFNGTLLFVSHDRYFIQRIASKMLLLEEGKSHFFDGDYASFLAKRNIAAGENESWQEHESLRDSINRLECQLAYLGGKLEERLTEAEKERLNQEYLEVARELNRLRQQLKRS